MVSPDEEIILVDESGRRINLQEIVESLCTNAKRVLADDEIVHKPQEGEVCPNVS